MTDLPIQDWLSAEQAQQDYPLLRRKISEVLTPGPWRHSDPSLMCSEWKNGHFICRKCRQPVDDGLSCAEPDVSIDPMEVLVERMLKALPRTVTVLTLACAAPQFNGAPPIKSDADVFWHLDWFILEATASEKAAVLLAMLEKEGKR